MQVQVRLLPALLFASVSVITSKTGFLWRLAVVRTGFPRASAPLDQPSALSDLLGPESRYRQGEK